jgi:hypothetical protein
VLYKLRLGFGHHLAPFRLPTRAALGAGRRGAGQPEHHAIAHAGAAGIEIERIDPHCLPSPGARGNSQAERAATLRAIQIGVGIRDKLCNRGRIIRWFRVAVTLPM